ncbi:MAG: hypothetical protein H0T45_03225 [Pyrinomonadaceae bacterium]|nr:hypothetical protein [Pyrinomonadaceae bacterium]MDQ3135157.1 hypothetical protein [Acidobacteriota bacterium]
MTTTSSVAPLRWRALPGATRVDFASKLRDLYQAPTDESAFDSLALDKQQTLLLLYRRLRELKLWHVVRSVENVYGEGGVGMNFAAWPVILSTLRRRPDFTRLFANHRNTAGGFYERRRATAVLHFLYVEGATRSWAVHFDLHSLVYSPISAWRHVRYEALGGVTPDWRMIGESLA